MASPIETTWRTATVLVEAGATRGTAFFVGREEAPGRVHVFAITNKHVLDPDPARRKALKSLRLHVNLEQSGKAAGKVVDYPLAGSDGSWVREHRDPNVDVLAFRATPFFNAHGKDCAHKCVPESMFALAAKRQELDITAGEEIVVVGYPSAIRQGPTNHPLVRQGIIATTIGEELHEEVPLPGGGTTIRKTRGFLIDGATIPGSSGSPVVLKPVIGRFQHGNVALGLTEPVLLGIVAETRFAPINVGGGTVIPGFAGLGLAFDVETIVEVLDLF